VKLWILLLCTPFLCLAPGCRPASQQVAVSTPTETNTTMNADTLESQVLAHRPESVATAAQLGSAAAPVLVRLASHTDPEVRAQALICFRAAGGRDATHVAIRALDDDDATVVAHAIQVLHVFPPRDDRALLVAYQKQEETAPQLALIAGRLGTNASVTAWKTNLSTAPAGTAQADALLSAVARMGDADARKAFAYRLEAARGYDAPPWIDRAVYQEQPWVLESLAKLLDRTERAAELTPDDPTDLRPLRTCDLAANAILKITRATVTFPAPRATPYTDTELAEFRRLAADAMRK
jgi:hypothetical protein